MTGTRAAMSSAAPLATPDLDALRELASIGCGHAVTALARLAGTRVDMDVPEIWVARSPGAIAAFVDGLGADLVAVGVRLEGVLAGHLVLALPAADAERLAAALGQSVHGAWSALAESALMETGNIAGSAFVSAIARLIGARLLLSVPALVRGGGRASLARLVGGEPSLALATRFLLPGPGVLDGLILVMPDGAQLPNLLSALDP